MASQKPADLNLQCFKNKMRGNEITRLRNKRHFEGIYSYYSILTGYLNLF